MSKLTPMSRLPYPEATDPADLPKHLQSLATELDSRTVLRFDDSASRDLAITQPVTGMVAHVKNRGHTTYDGTAWVPLFDQPLAIYLQTTAQSIPSGGTSQLNWPAPQFDTHGGYKSATPTRYTPVMSGHYLVTAQISFSVNANGGRVVNLMKNGTAGFGQAAHAAIPGTAYNTTVVATGLIYLNGVGDYIEIQVAQNSGSTIATVAPGADSSTKLTVLRVHS
ncbi:hypothetical protein [Kitasatospora sp. P5_F3]